MRGKHKFGRIVCAAMVAVVVTITLVAVDSSSVSAATSPGCTTTSQSGLQACSDADLSSIYQNAVAATIPNGYHSGFVMAGVFSLVVGLYWSGKSFNGSTVTNVGGGGLFQGYPGKVSMGASMRDGKPSVIIDYSGTALSYMRDEIRQLTPNLWLGYAMNVSSGQPIAAFGLN